jgi:phospholipase C
MRPHLTRREALLAGAGAGMALTTPVSWARKHHRRSDLERVEHVVILMQENRSFDHYFGTLAGVRGFSDPDAIKLPDGHSVFEQPYPLTPDGFLSPWRFDPAASNPCNVLVDNGWAARHSAWNGGAMDGFTGATAGTPNYFVMSYYDRADLPWHTALADAFTVCDGYFSSVMGPTNPNRLMMWTGTIDPSGRHGGPDNDNQAYSNAGTRYTWKTYPERLQAAGVSWRVYHETDDFDDNALKYFATYQDAKPGSPLYENAMKNRAGDAFMQDVAADRLPQVSWIVAPTASSEHPMYSPGRGADYCNRIFQAFKDRRDIWAKTAFILTYDEDGGYFDHVRPPTPPAGTRDEFVDGLPIGLGFRVPTVVCSPWTRGGYVCSQTYDHTSLIRFLERRFGVIEPQISAWRRKTCGDLWECFDFTRADTSFPHLPETAAGAATADAQCANGPPAAPRVLNEAMPEQSPGAKPRRPCAKRPAPVVIHLPKHPRLLGGTLRIGRHKRRLSARELRRRRIVVRSLPAGTTAEARIRLRVRFAGRKRTIVITRTLRSRCP